MSKTGKFLKKHEEEGDIQKEIADIHPFSQVKPKKRKKIIILVLAISTIFVYTFIGYLLYKDVYLEKKKIISTNKPTNNQELISSNDLKVIKKEIEYKISSHIKDLSIPEMSHLKITNPKKANYKYYLLKAKEAEIKGEIKNAIKFYKEAWHLSKKDPQILYRIAFLYFKSKKYKSAEEFAKRLIKIKKDHLKGMILLAKTYEKRGKIKKARLILEEAYFQFPESKEVLENLGKIYEKENALIIAKDIYQSLADMGYLEGKLGLARIYEKLNDKKSALKIYRKIYLDPNIPENLRSKIENKIISLE